MKTYIALATAMLSVAAVPVTAAELKPTIVLVHGALETSDVWGHVIAKLHQDGFKVRNVGLPGRRGNELPMSNVSLDLYQQTVAKAIAGEVHPVVLVGHGSGGITISAEAEAEPQKIKTLVYVAAYIPQNGDSLLKLATRDKGSKLGTILMVNKEKGFVAVPPAVGGALFASDASPAIQRIVASGIVNEPLAPLATPVTLTADRFRRVNKVVIHTLRDEVVSPQLQTEMISTTPIHRELMINSGHAPFMTRPKALAADIEKAAG